MHHRDAFTNRMNTGPSPTGTGAMTPMQTKQGQQQSAGGTDQRVLGRATVQWQRDAPASTTAPRTTGRRQSESLNRCPVPTRRDLAGNAETAARQLAQGEGHHDATRCDRIASADRLALDARWSDRGGHGDRRNEGHALRADRRRTMAQDGAHPARTRGGRASGYRRVRIGRWERRTGTTQRCRNQRTAFAAV